MESGLRTNKVRDCGGKPRNAPHLLYLGESNHGNMQSDQLLVHLVLILLGALLGGLVLDRLRQPPIMGYILAGVVLGNVFFGAIPDRRFLEVAGEMGLIFLLFFIGAETDVPRMVRNWRIPVLGTVLQLTLSIGACLGVSSLVGWRVPEALFFGCMISLSSTAVVLRILDEFGGASSYIGRNAFAISLVQDLAVVPMLIFLALAGGTGFDGGLLVRQLVGGGAVAMLAFWLASRPRLTIPAWIGLQKSKDFSLMAGLIFCLGAASLTGILGLSPALGAFLAGVVVARLEGSMEPGQFPLRKSLEPFKMLFVAAFFMFVGLLLDLNFVRENWVRIGLLVILVFMVNSVLTALVLRLLGMAWVEALVLGCLLAQIGEFAFLLAAFALNHRIIDGDIYQTAIAVIALSLLLSPVWLSLARRIMRQSIGRSGTMAFCAVEPNRRPI